MERHKLNKKLIKIESNIEDIDTNLKQKRAEKKVMLSKKDKNINLIEMIINEIDTFNKTTNSENELYKKMKKDIINDILNNVDVMCSTIT